MWCRACGAFRGGEDFPWTSPYTRVAAADLESAQATIARLQAELGTPIPMRLVCEGCGELHIDEGEFATKPHHTHTCQKCGLNWRPAKVATVGVQWLPGYKNKAGAL